MIYEESIPLSQHDILDARECEEARDRVMALKTHWNSRGEGSFFTLGAASYLDASRHRADYLQGAKATNPILHGTFGWLHERVRTFFEDLLGETFSFDQRYGLPGFHIFLYGGEDRSSDLPAKRAHFDLQWMHAVPDQTPAGTLSFTLPIELPSGGSSMEIWHVRYKEAVQLGFTSTEYATQHASQTVKYVPGRVVVHDGFILHAIGRASIAAPRGLRITLQGHGVRLPRGWLLYW